jgi:serine/threonine-protein kinase
MSAHAPVPQIPEAPLAASNDNLIAERFEIEAPAGTDQLGDAYLARDKQTRKQVSLLLLSRQLAAEAPIIERIHAAAQAAGELTHPGLACVYASGTHEGRHFIAREAIVGRNVDTLIAEQRARGRTLSLRGVYNLIAHVCKAVGALPAGSAHGALRPGVIWVTKSGRVKLADYELGSALAQLGRSDLLPASEQAFLAPEVKRGQLPDARSDVFGVGALLYALLTARSPLDAFVIPSQLRPDASPQLDAVMMRCLAADPSQRYPSTSDVIKVIMPLVAAAPVPAEEDFELDVEIDVDVAASLAPPAQRNPAFSVPVLIANDSLPAPVAPAAVARPAAPKPPAPAPKTAKAAVPAADQLAELTARLTTNDTPRWIAVKSGLDHGPFTARELIKLIVDGDVREEHLLFNMASNERKRVSEYGEFAPFIEQYRIRRDENEQAAALVHSKQVEKRSNAAKFLILATAIGAIALVGGGYIMNRKAAGERRRSEANLADLYESGQVRISGTAGVLKLPARGAGTRRSGDRPSPGPGGFSSYEDAMNQAVELNVAKNGGERQLTGGEVAGVMNRELNRLFGCVGEELRRGGKLGSVGIDLAILGSGRVAGASVHAGSPGFQRCIASKLNGVHFPEFPAPRMGARYSFQVD